MAEALFPKDTPGLSHCDFSEMGLQVGDRIEFQVTPAGLHPRLFTRLIGYAPGESLLIRTPLQNRLPVNVHEGQQVVVRAFSGTKAFAFFTTVQRLCIAPFFYMHLAFPEEIQCVEVRRDHRLPLRLLAEAKVADAWQPVMLLDLGMGGALVESNHALGGAGDPILLRFGFPLGSVDEEARITVSGILHHVESRPGADGLPDWRQGVSFHGLGTADSVMLQNLLLRLLTEARGQGA